MNAPTARSGFLLLLAAVSTVLMAMIIAPFAGSLFAAAVLAGVLQPWQTSLQDRLGDRPALAAGALTAGVTAVAVAPLALVCVYAAQILTSLYRDVRETLERDGVDGLIASLPDPLQGVGRRIADLLAERGGGGSPDAGGGETASGEPVLSGSELQTAASLATETFDRVFALMIDLGVLIVATFFLLSQGQRLVAWIRGVLPLSDEQSRNLVEELRDVTRAVFAATILTAFLQTAIAAIAYWIASVPYLPVVLLLTFLAALIPVIGAAVVVVSIGGLYLLTEQTGYGIFLIAWGVVAVGFSDNVAKPWLARDGARLPGSVVLFAMLGGVAVFGPMGIVAGPLVVALFLTTLRLLRDEEVVPGRA